MAAPKEWRQLELGGGVGGRVVNVCVCACARPTTTAPVAASTRALACSVALAYVKKLTGYKTGMMAHEVTAEPETAKGTRHTQLRRARWTSTWSGGAAAEGERPKKLSEESDAPWKAARLVAFSGRR